MFGGLSDTGTTLGDTWEWDGVDWTLRSPASLSPTARWAHSMAYHPGRATTMLFGGFAGGDNGECWEWDGNDWAQVVTPTGPNARRATDMAYDTVSGNMILFSGWQQINDTWVFDGADWLLAAPATSPPARYDHSIETDYSRNRIVLFGRAGTSYTWEWDGTTWIDRTPATLPAPRVDTYLAYDWVREEVTMFGSVPTPETWRYAPTDPASYVVTPGGGCVGTTGTAPALSSSDQEVRR
jgi:hypothetical protein